MQVGIRKLQRQCLLNVASLHHTQAERGIAKSDLPIALEGDDALNIALGKLACAQQHLTDMHIQRLRRAAAALRGLDNQLFCRHRWNPYSFRRSNSLRREAQEPRYLGQHQDIGQCHQVLDRMHAAIDQLGQHGRGESQHAAEYHAGQQV